MDILEFNEYVNQIIIDEKAAENVLKKYHFLKKVNKSKRIVDVNNQEKFIALLKKLSRWITNINFSYENFHSMNLNKMRFHDCTFIEANFENAELDVIEFHSCNLDYASFCNAVMECACFQKCSCRKTDFSKAHLMAAYIQESDWSEADVSGVNLLEVEAQKWKIDGMIVNENTAIGEGEFYEVNWSKMNVSRLNISLNQVKYFLQSTNGGRDLQVYDDYTPSLIQKREDAILKALCDEYEQKEMAEYEVYCEDKNLIFLSYASEQEEIVRGFYDGEKTKYHLWMDIELVREDELKIQIDRMLNICKTAVIFLSKEYLVKAWTRYELWRLLEEKKNRNIEIVIVQLTKGFEDTLKQYWSTESFFIVRNIKELGDWIHVNEAVANEGG